jgi:hypothetical protein
MKPRPVATRAFWPPQLAAHARAPAIVEPIRLGELAHIQPTHIDDDDPIVESALRAYATAPPLIRLRRFRANALGREIAILDGNHRLIALRRLLAPHDWILVEVER